MKRFFPNKGCHGNRESIFPVIVARIAKRENASQKHKSCRYIIPLKKIELTG